MSQCLFQHLHYNKKTTLLQIHATPRNFSTYSGHLQGGDRTQLISPTKHAVLIIHKYQWRICDMFRYQCSIFWEHKVPLLKPIAYYKLLFEMFFSLQKLFR